MAMSAATLKGYREICGLTQQALADLAGVSIMAVKKWEKGEREVPADVSDLVLSRYAQHCRWVDEIVDNTPEIPEPSVVSIEYFRSQEQADIASERDTGVIGTKAHSYQEMNAAARSAAEILMDSGQLVVFNYPDSEDAIRAKREKGVS